MDESLIPSKDGATAGAEKLKYVVGDEKKLWDKLKFVTLVLLFLRVCLNVYMMLVRRKETSQTEEMFGWARLSVYVVYVNNFESCVFAIYLLRLCAYVGVTCCCPRIWGPAAQDCAGWSALVCLRFLTVDHFFRYRRWVKSYVRNRHLTTCCTLMYPVLFAVFGSIGVVALAVKVVRVSSGLQQDDGFVLCHWLKLAAFANQMISLTDISSIRMAQQQIAIFDKNTHASGGNAEIDPGERNQIILFFNACAQKIWKSTAYGYIQKTVILATFDHNDLHLVSLKHRRSYEKQNPQKEKPSDTEEGSATDLHLRGEAVLLCVIAGAFIVGGTASVVKQALDSC
ncbi:unnamed protein product [Prorocentrum cordatum]|uniref:Uncharacterized protein n=1 Tax=Prorocentrum cordatum TaxID=2364126 RepID=A0ABN9V1B2_9DINO|nr:unnamed protein product [Polarella glacialis]